MDHSEILTSEFEYELIDISWSLEYDLGSIPHAIYVADEGDLSELIEPQNEIEYDKDGIPMGGSMEEIRMRSKIINEFFKHWSAENPERQVFNKALEEFVHIRNVSVIEASEHSSKSYPSTIAALSFEEVIKNAKPVQRVPVKVGSSNQADFMYLLVMRYIKDGLGTVKLTVGIRKIKGSKERDTEKVEYGISVLQPNEKLIDYSLFKSKQKKNKKAPHKDEMQFCPMAKAWRGLLQTEWYFWWDFTWREYTMRYTS